MLGAPAASFTVSGASGMWRNCSVGPRKAGLYPGGLRTSGLTVPCDCTPSRTVIGLMLVSLARLTLGNQKSAGSMMKTLSEVNATLVRVRTKGLGRRATVMLAPELTAEQRKAVQTFDLGRWMPILLSSRS